MTGLMSGKRGLIMGLANDKSLAWGISKRLAEQGAELAFSYQGEALKKRVGPLAAEVGSDFMIECDVADMADLDRLFEDAEGALGDDRLRRPCDRLLRQERAARQICRHQPRQFPDVDEHLRLQLHRRRPPGPRDDAERRQPPHLVLLRRREGHPPLQRHGPRQGGARDQRQISGDGPRPREYPGQRHLRRADQDPGGERHRRLPLHLEVERI